MHIPAKLRKASRIRVGLPPALPTRTLLTETVQDMFDPSLLPLDAGQRDEIRFMCREHYYQIDERGIMIGPPILAKTRNWLHRAVRDGDQFRVADSQLVAAFNGIEDLRFYDHAGSIYIAGTRPDFSGAPRNTPFVASVGDVQAGTMLSDLRPFGLHAETAAIEKNWVYFEDGGRLFLERFPGMNEYYELDLAAGRLEYHCRQKLPFVWSGTKSVRWRGGNLFLDHKRVYPVKGLGTVMRFSYRFRFHAAGMGPPIVSPEFSLMPDVPGPVYASDMAIDEHSVWIGVGVLDRNSEILVCAQSEVARLLGM